MRPYLQRIDLTEGTSFRAFERREAHYPFDWHHHPEIELTFIASGSGRRYVGDAVEDYAAGDCVLLGPLLPHTWASHGNGVQVAYVVQFNPEWIERMMGGVPELHRIALLLSRCQTGLRFGNVSRLSLQQAMPALIKSGGVDRLTTLLKVLDTLARSRSTEVLASAAFLAARPAMDSRLAAINRYLQQHLTEPITQDQAAEIAGLTPSAFCRFFKRSTGRTFVAHLHELRIGRACQLLIETPSSITDACFSSGFGNLSNFNRIFRRLKGASPRHYRAKFRGSDVQPPG